MISTTEPEDRPAYDILALKTVEMLDVVNSTRQLLIEKYNNDQTMWLESMFRVLRMKNSTFLSDERNSSIRDCSVNKILRDQMFEMYRVSDEQNFWSSGLRKSSTNEVFDSNLRNQLHETSCNLIASFRVFTNFLLQTKFDMMDEIPNLQTISKNIDKYVQRSSCEREKTKLAASKLIEDVVKTEADPVEVIHKVPLIINKDKPLTPTEVIANNRICDVCGDPVAVFNDDEEFSMTLHEQEGKHQQAVEKQIATAKSNNAAPQAKSIADDISAGSNLKTELSADEETKIREIIVEKVGPLHAKLLRINAFDDFSCSACQCKVMSMNNVFQHVQGKTHKKNSGIKDIEADNETELRTPSANSEIDSPEEAVFRVGSPIPMKSLF